MPLTYSTREASGFQHYQSALLRQHSIVANKGISLTFRVTPGKRIPNEWRATGADGVVVDDVTESAKAAGAWAGVSTVLVDASLVESTL